MTARELLNDLAELGFNITAEGDKLVVSPWSKLTDDLLVALRAAKPELLALASATPGRSVDLVRASARTCSSCAHLLRRGTCAEPVIAGLAEWFGIRWPPAGHAARCHAYTSASGAGCSTSTSIVTVATTTSFERPTEQDFACAKPADILWSRA